MSDESGDAFTSQDDEYLDPHRSDEGIRMVSLSGENVRKAIQAWKDTVRKLLGRD